MLLQDTTTHYYVLGDLTQQATPDDIKKAYRRLARTCHPDVVGVNDPVALQLAEEQFKRITFAYETLMDPTARRRYDRTYSPDRFVPEISSSYMGANITVRPVQPSMILAESDSVRMQDAWEEFISKPFEWAEKGRRFYERWEWVLSIAYVGVMYLVLTGQIITYNILEFVLTTNSNPSVESNIPVYGMLAGTYASLALTGIVALWTIRTHRFSYRRSQLFRQRLGKLAWNLFITSAIAFGIVGMLIGRYLL